MWFDNPFAKALCWVIILALVVPFEVSANTPAPQPSPVFKKEELTQLLAPVALYPDALLAQMLMASTYPLEVVQADRWVKGNPGLKGENLDEAIRDMQWDMSVKSLCHFPQVLAMMSDKIDWTQRVGDAFLAQQRDVMDVIQELRSKAYNAGNLTTTNEQVVFVRDSRVIIEPASPGVLYVPVYDPLVVYGPWWYPYYPPYSFYWPYWYPGVVIGPGVVFSTAFFVGAAVLSWCSFGWYNYGVYVSPHYAYPYHKGYYGHRPGYDRKDYWRHNPTHRRNVPYRDSYTARNYGAPSSRSFESRQDIRQNPQTARDVQNELSARRGTPPRADASRPAYGAAQSPRGASDRSVYGRPSPDPGRYSRSNERYAQQPATNAGRGRGDYAFRNDQRSPQAGRYSQGSTGRQGTPPAIERGRTGSVPADRGSASIQRSAPGSGAQGRGGATIRGSAPSVSAQGRGSATIRGSAPSGGVQSGQGIFGGSGGGFSGSMRGGPTGGGFSRGGRL